jgi:hypothetical protein
MAHRSQALAAAAGAGLVARAIIYSVVTFGGQGQWALIPMDAAIKAVVIVLIGGAFAWFGARSTKSWGLIHGASSFVIACAVVYLETLIKFPALLAKLTIWDFAVVFAQWLPVSFAAALVATYVLREATWSHTPADQPA